MSQPLRVLFVEDCAEDAALLVRELERAGYAVTFERVQTREALTAALALPTWDLLVCDYSMAGFNGMEALALWKERDLDIPFIFASGNMGEDIAVAAMKAGAHDYLLKGNLRRFIPAVERELREAEARRRHRQAEAQLGKLSSAVEQAGNCIWITDKAGVIEYVNPAFEKATGYTRAEALGQTPRLLKSGKHDHPFYARLWQTILAGQVFYAEFVNRRKNGELYHQEQTITPVKDGAGNVTHFVATGRDITERKQAEATLLRSEQTFAKLFRANPAAMSMNTVAGRLIDVNERYCEFFGYPREELIGRSVVDLRLWANPRDRDPVIQRLQWEGSISSLETKYRRKDGEERDVLVAMELVEIAGATEPVMISMFTDITERQRAEALLRYRTLFEQSPVGVVTVELQSGLPVEFNDLAARQLGYSREEFARLRIGDYEASETPEQTRARIERLLREGADQFETRHRTKTGEIRNVLVTVRAMKLKGQALANCVFQDITERVRAEENLRNSEALYHSLVENLPQSVFRKDPAGRFTFANDRFRQTVGQTADQILGRTDFDFYPRELAEKYHADDQRVIQSGAALEMEEAHQLPNGNKIFVQIVKTPLYDAEGHVIGLQGIFWDITERKQLEEQFRQAQKMDAIGQLAGGVAHDFNNLLTVIQGYAQLLLTENGLRSEGREPLNLILSAAERAGNLTRQLLAFSRKQVLQPEVLDCQEVVDTMTKMLRRLIGENILLELSRPPAPAHIRADRGMVEQVLLNLVVNARDAMPSGGQLTIAVATAAIDDGYRRLHPEATAGQFVCLSVGDTGHGIAPEHLPHIFEPFFTTKAPGKGTGLGLATVYGIVRQHQGWLEVASTVGKGATFRIFLPAINAAQAASPPMGTMTPAALRGIETILLVEDDPLVRRLTRITLERVGYQVLEAESGPAALAVWRQRAPEVAVLLSDLVMPGGLSGFDLADQLRKERPQLKIIFISGYSQEALEQASLLGPGRCFLRKPFTAQQLGETVRHCLDGK